MHGQNHIKVASNNENHVGLHEECLSFVSDFQQNIKYAVKPLKINRHENLSTVLKSLHADIRIGRGIWRSAGGCFCNLDLHGRQNLKTKIVIYIP